MLCYKFLREGHTGLFSGFTWPLEEWVDVDGRLVPTRRGIHACRERDLAYWLDEELWVAELDGEILEDERMLVASRGRLVEKVESWDEDAMRALVDVCVARARAYPTGEDAVGWAEHPAGAVSAIYIAAHAAGVGASEGGRPYDEAFADERAWQADWIVRRLALEPLEL